MDSLFEFELYRTESSRNSICFLFILYITFDLFSTFQHKHIQIYSLKQKNHRPFFLSLDVILLLLRGLGICLERTYSSEVVHKFELDLRFLCLNEQIFESFFIRNSSQHQMIMFFYQVFQSGSIFITYHWKLQPIKQNIAISDFQLILFCLAII